MIDELTNILQKVRMLYRRYGIKSVTMDDVSHELSISKKTLYQYVRDKDELVKKVIELELSSQDDHMIRSCDDNLNAIEELAQIASCINYMLKEYSTVVEYDLRKYYPDLYLKVREVRRERILRFILENLEKGKAQGLYREDMNTAIVAKLGLSHIDSMFESEIISITEFLEQKFFLEYFVYHLRGIVNDKGLKVLEHEIQKIEIKK